MSASTWQSSGNPRHGALASPFGPQIDEYVRPVGKKRKQGEEKSIAAHASPPSRAANPPETVRSCRECPRVVATPWAEAMIIERMFAVAGNPRRLSASIDVTTAVVSRRLRLVCGVASG
jgi:hypothetical protein